LKKKNASKSLEKNVSGENVRMETELDEHDLKVLAAIGDEYTSPEWSHNRRVSLLNAHLPSSFSGLIDAVLNNLLQILQFFIFYILFI